MCGLWHVCALAVGTIGLCIRAQYLVGLRGFGDITERGLRHPPHSPATVQSPLAPVTVPPYSTQDISLAALVSQFPAALPFGSVRIQYSGSPGSLQAEVSSVESQGNLVVDSHVLNEGNPWAGSGANPWHLDPDTESILFLTNESDQPARIGFKVSASSVTYHLTKLQLSPHDTRAIDLRKLRDAQQPDFKNNKLPAAATDGSVMWVRGDNLPVMGRLMLIHRQQGMASNYDCNQCACPYTYDPALDYVYPPGANIPVGGNFTCILYAGFQDCNHNDYYYNENGSTSWTSGDNSIATVDSSGTVTAGPNAGTTTATGQFSGYAYVWNQQMWYCSYSLTQGGGGCTENVGDRTPVVTSISPSPWVSGHTYTNGTISGQYFGTSPGVSLSDLTISFSYTPGAGAER